LLIEFAREAITPTASRERLADWDRRATAWREKHAALVEGAEQANAALRAVLPRDPKARWF
jgi:hypothetical protein